MYIAGLIGLNIEGSRNFFRFLTPFHLLSSAGILIYFEEKKPPSFYFYLVTSFFIGFFIEVAGVNTGVIFGEYKYGETLGPKLWNTPLMIGINWFVLSFVVAKVLSQLSHQIKFLSHPLALMMAGAASMTFLDFFAENPAIYHDMWSWELGKPPLQNFIGWFIVSAVLMLIFQKLKLGKAKNPLAFWVLLLQFLFFFIQYLILL